MKLLEKYAYILTLNDVFNAYFNVFYFRLEHTHTCGSSNSAVVCWTCVYCSCVTEDALNVKKIVQSMDRAVGNATTMTLRFKVFKLRYSSQLVFENVIKACRRSVDCRPPVRRASRLLCSLS